MNRQESSTKYLPWKKSKKSKTYLGWVCGNVSPGPPIVFNNFYEDGDVAEIWKKEAGIGRNQALNTGVGISDKIEMGGGRGESYVNRTAVSSKNIPELLNFDDFSHVFPS